MNPSKAPAMTSISVWPIDSFSWVYLSCFDLSSASGLMFCEIDIGVFWLLGLRSRAAFFNSGSTEFNSLDCMGSRIGTVDGDFSFELSVKTAVPLFEELVYKYVSDTSWFNTFAWMPTSLRTPYKSKMFNVRHRRQNGSFALRSCPFLGFLVARLYFERLNYIYE